MAKVYFTKEITPDALIKMYEKVGVDLKGKVALKLHSGEDGNQNFLRPDFMKKLQEKLGATVVETNTAYQPSEREFTKNHRELLEKHGWSKYYDVDILDEEGNEEIEIPSGKQIKKDIVGTHLKNYDSMLVLAHFKGHPAGGYGGALKQLSIGCASRAGKAYIHSGGITDDAYKCWDYFGNQTEFLEAMADAAYAVDNLFKGKIVYINVMKNLSVDCDCCSNAEDPCMEDIGILASTDPVAIDRACLDLVINSSDPGKEHFMERVTSRNGEHTIECAESLGAGTTNYELIEI